MSFGQGGPSGPGGPQQSPSQSGTPDWGALADRTAARMRRRRMVLMVGGAIATAAVAAVVATAVVNANSSDDKPQSLPTPETLPAEPEQPEPTFSDVSVPPPPDPLDFISDERKDTAPLSASTLFPGKSLTMSSRSYDKGATATTKSCGSAASARLAPALTGNGCDQVIRASFERGGVAVTVGVAVFDTQAQASKAKQRASGNIQSLSGGGIPSFCRATACRLTTNSIGRYAYFTVSGYTSGKAVTASDIKARQAGKDIADFTFARIVDRGEAQASAAATAQTTN
ncbi:hypothetical protein [Streptomyces sp. 8N616]|uniref:hypothetical protein n=1 Tax=Streptomyces sp. 8N616 TaxID=3457414 RepID=UPI003FD68CD5